MCVDGEGNGEGKKRLCQQISKLLGILSVSTCKSYGSCINSEKYARFGVAVEDSAPNLLLMRHVLQVLFKFIGLIIVWQM